MDYWKCENFFPTTWQVKRYNCRFLQCQFCFWWKEQYIFWVILPTDHFISYRFLFIRNQIQMKKHCKITFVWMHYWESDCVWICVVYLFKSCFQLKIFSIRSRAIARGLGAPWKNIDVGPPHTHISYTVQYTSMEPNCMLFLWFS